MSSRLAKRLSSFSFSFSFSSFHQHHFSLLTPLLRLLSSTQPHEPKEIPFLAKYLISSFGFSPDRALKVSTNRRVAAIKFSDRPDTVVRFLKDAGLLDAEIKGVVTFHPYLLACNVEKTLKPNVQEWMDRGFSGELLVQLIRYNPPALVLKGTLSRLLFWRDFVGNCDRALLKIIQRNGLLITYPIDKFIVPRLNLLNEYGLLNQDIAVMLGSGYGCCMNKSLDSLRQILELIEELGVPRESGMFLRAFKSLHACKIDKVKRKVEFYMTKYGWSKEEVYSGFRKFPSILAFSEVKIKSNMDFLIIKAKLEPRSIAARPLLLGFSLEKRLIPRYHVVSILVAKGLMKSSSLYTACKVSEKRFLEKYVEPYKKDVPQLIFLPVVGHCVEQNTT